MDLLPRIEVMARPHLISIYAVMIVESPHILKLFVGDNVPKAAGLSHSLEHIPVFENHVDVDVIVFGLNPVAGYLQASGRAVVGSDWLHRPVVGEARLLWSLLRRSFRQKSSCPNPVDSGDASA